MVSRGAQPEAKKSTGQFLTRTKKPELSARGLRRSPAYFDRGYAAHAETVRQVQALYSQLYPESSR